LSIRRPHSSSRAALFVVLALACAGAAGAQEVRYQSKITDANRVGLTLTNYGFLGNNFISRTPSFEYPLGEGLEHMSRAGLWIGGLAVTDTGLALRVSHAAVDNAQGSNQVSETEYTPLPGAIIERSRLVTSKNYAPDARGDRDLHARLHDRPADARSGVPNRAPGPRGLHGPVSQLPSRGRPISTAGGAAP